MEPMMPDIIFLFVPSREMQDPRDRVPFSCIRVVNAAMSILGQRGQNVLRLTVAAGDVAALDTRQPCRTKYPVVLHAGPLRCGQRHDLCLRSKVLPPTLNLALALAGPEVDFSGHGELLTSNDYNGSGVAVFAPTFHHP